jgi:integrase
MDTKTAAAPRIARRTAPLTSREIAALPPGLHHDPAVRGLFVRVLPTGGRSLVLRFSLDKRRRDMHLGGLPDVSLAEAREEARRARALLRQGIDPIEARNDARTARKAGKALAAWTFERLAREVHETLRPTWKNSKHADQWINTLSTYAFPTIGARPVGDVDVEGVIGVLRPLWTTKPETAGRVRQRLDAVMERAVAQKLAVTNPVGPAAVLLGKLKKRVEHHAALPVAELPGFVRRLRAGAAGVPSRRALDFAILTAARSGEVRGATWGEIDFEGATWTVPAERMKATRAHEVPLSPAALALLRDVAAERGVEPAAKPGALVFPAPRGKPMSDNAFGALLDRMKVTVTAHGFRSTFRDWCAEQGIPREVAERALAHAVGNRVEAAYNRATLLVQRREVMQRWADFIATPAGDAQETAGDE